MKNHVYEWKNVVIGSNYKAVSFAYKRNYHLIFNELLPPFPWEKISNKPTISMLDEFDRKIIFSAGIFLILSTTITSIFVSKVQANASERAQDYLNQIINNNDDNDIDIDN